MLRLGFSFLQPELEREWRFMNLGIGFPAALEGKRPGLGEAEGGATVHTVLVRCIPGAGTGVPGVESGQSSLGPPLFDQRHLLWAWLCSPRSAQLTRLGYAHTRECHSDGKKEPAVLAQRPQPRLRGTLRREDACLRIRHCAVPRAAPGVCRCSVRAERGCCFWHAVYATICCSTGTCLRWQIPEGGRGLWLAGGGGGRQREGPGGMEGAGS